MSIRFIGIQVNDYTQIWILVNAVTLLVMPVLSYIRYKSVRDIVDSKSIDAEIIESSIPKNKNDSSSFNVKYLYQVNGKEFTANYDHRLVTDYQRFVANNPTGTKIEVFASLNKPEFVLIEAPSKFKVISHASQPYFLFWLSINFAFVYGA